MLKEPKNDDDMKEIVPPSGLIRYFYYSSVRTEMYCVSKKDRTYMKNRCENSDSPSIRYECDVVAFDPDVINVRLT